MCWLVTSSAPDTATAPVTGTELAASACREAGDGRAEGIACCESPVVGGGVMSDRSSAQHAPFVHPSSLPSSSCALRHLLTTHLLVPASGSTAGAAQPNALPAGAAGEEQQRSTAEGGLGISSQRDSRPVKAVVKSFWLSTLQASKPSRLAGKAAGKQGRGKRKEGRIAEETDGVSEGALGDKSRAERTEESYMEEAQGGRNSQTGGGGEGEGEEEEDDDVRFMALTAFSCTQEEMAR